MATPVFSNRPKVCTKQLSLDETLTLPKFNAFIEGNPDTNTGNNFANACGDPNLGTTFYKNVVNQLIRCAGENIDINFVRDLFPIESAPTRMVDTKRWYNHYMCDTNMNIYFAAGSTATTAGGTFVAQILKQFHGGSGQYSLPAVGYSLWDKDAMIEYRVMAIDSTTPYAHKVTLQPTDETVVGSVKVNVPYLVTPARAVGGCSCKEVTNSLSTIGYSQEVRPLRVRRDWEICIDILRGYLDKIQYAVIYDLQGNPMDSFDVYEAQQARLGVQMALNIAAFWGTPTTNPSLIDNLDNTKIDEFYPGFYGLMPSLRYGGAVVYGFNPSEGFDMENDGEPLFLWQDSQKRTHKFLIMHGLAWKFGTNNRANKLVARTDVGSNIWEAYRRMGTLSNETYEQAMVKFGVKKYEYESFELDTKLIGAFSDARYAGSSYWSNIGICAPKHGVKQNGRDINPIEFYQIGKDGWTGAYEEFYVDGRKTESMCEKLMGYSAESMAMATHCPELWIILEPKIAA